MSGFKVGDSGLYQSLWVEGALDSSLGWEAEDKGFGNDCLAVLQMAKDFFHGDLALFALWEHAGQVIVLDNQGRAWCTQKGSEIEHELGILLGLAGNNCHSVNPETPSFKHLSGNGERIESCLLKQVPAEDGKQGLFLVVSKQRNFFAPREYQLLGIFAANLGFARCNRLLSTRADRLSQAFAALEDIGTAIARTNDFEEVLGLVLQKLEQLTGAESGGVLLYDGEKQELVLQRPAFGAQNEDTALYRLSVCQDRPSEGLAVEVFLRRQPYICNDAPADKKSNQQYIKLFGIRNFVTIPLVMENRGIGVLHLVNKRQGYFTEQDVQLLSILASELAVLIENARLINQTKQQERESTALFQVGMEISASLDLEAIFQSVVNKVRALMDCDMAAISKLEEDGRYAHMTYVTRDTMERVRQLRVVSGRGLTGRVLETRDPLGCVYGEQTPALLREYDDLDLVVLAEGMRSAVAVPLAIGERIHGVLYSWRKKAESFSPREIELLARFSNQAVIAIENAWLYTSQRETLARLQSSKELIELQHDRLSRSVSIHKEFTQMVLEGRGLKSIARTLAQIVDCQVEVTDQFFRLIASSSVEPEDGFQEQALYLREQAELVANDKVREFFARLAREKMPGRLPWGEEGLDGGQNLEFGNRVVAPVVVGTDVLGYVFIQETGKILEEMDIMAVEHASTVIALEMMKEKIKSEIIGRLKGDCLDDLLAGSYKSEQEILDRANYLGYDLSKPFQVLVVDIDNFREFVVRQQGDEGVVARVKQRLFEVVNNVVIDASPQSIITGKSDSLVILAHEGGQGRGSNTGKSNGNKGKHSGRGTGGRVLSPVELAREIKNKVSLVFAEITVSVGVGRVAHRLKDIRESHQEAKTCLNMLKKFGHRDRLITFEQLGVYRLLHRVEDVQELADFARQVLEPVVAYDAKFGTMLVDTLRCYVENNFNLQKTAKNSYLHINTLNYRLKRIQEIGKLDLNEPEQRLNVQVALKIMDVLPEGIGRFQGF